MAESTGGDKTEAPTARKRQEAREAGNVARSPDIASGALLVGGLVLLKYFGGGVINALADLTHYMLSEPSLANVDPRAGDGGAAMARSIAAVALAVAPLLAGVVGIVVLANVAQTGLSFNPARLAFRGSALNPIRGLSRLFSGGQGLMQLAQSSLKVLLVAAVAYSAIGGRIGLIIRSQELSFTQIFALAADVLFAVALRIGVMLLVLSVGDYVWRRHRLEQQLKMSKQEVKDEMRSMDGDPHVKQRRRQLAMAALKERLKVDVPKADVVVTNPTEFAVALRYDPDAMAAPRVVAKGQGMIAARIRQIAIEAGVPILERKPLARALYKLCDVGHEVPEQFFSAVAEILAYVYELNGRFKQKHFAKAS
jgi:flagellar biosynthetic protein FlhB